MMKVKTQPPFPPKDHPSLSKVNFSACKLVRFIPWDARDGWKDKSDESESESATRHCP